MRKYAEWRTSYRAVARTREGVLIQTLIKNWWLLVLCGVLYAVVSVLFLIMQDQDGPLTLQAFKGTAGFLGKFALGAGVCTILAGIWRSTKGKCWLLVLNGLALSALGLISSGIFGVRSFAISFRTVALLFVVMAMSVGILEVVTARALRRQRHVANEWFLGLAGAASVGFALAFFCFGFSLDPNRSKFSWYSGRPDLALTLISLVWLLFWSKRNLHAVAGPEPAQPGSFPIRPIGKPQARTLSRRFVETINSQRRFQKLSRERTGDFGGFFEAVD